MTLDDKILSAKLNRNAEPNNSGPKARIQVKTGVAQEEGERVNNEIQRQANEQKSKPQFKGAEQQQYETLVRMTDSVSTQELVTDFINLDENTLYLKYRKYLAPIKGEVAGLKQFVHRHAKSLSKT